MVKNPLKKKNFIIFYRDGTYDKVNEITLRNEIATNCNSITQIVARVFDTDLPVYIPINPTKLLLFSTAEVKFITAIYTADYDRTDVPPDVTFDESEPIKVNSILEFANALNYAYKVRSFMDIVGTCEEAYPSSIANFLMVDGVSIILKDSNDKIIYDESIVVETSERMNSIAEAVFDEDAAIIANEMLDEFTNLSDFITPFGDIGRHEIKLNGSKYKIETHHKPFSLDKPYLFQVYLGNFYILLDGEFIHYLNNKIGECCFLVTNLALNERFKKDFGPWDDSVKPLLKDAMMTDPYSIDYYLQFAVYTRHAEDYMQMLAYIKPYLDYVRYVLYRAILEESEVAPNIRSFIVYGNPEIVDIRNPKSGMEIIMDYDKVSGKEVFEKIDALVGAD